MFLATQDYLDQKFQLWSTIPRLVTYKNNLDELLSRILQKAEETKQGTGISYKKAQLKKILGIKVSGLSGVLQAYAHDTGNLDLAEAIKTSKSDITRLRDQDVEAIVSKVLAVADEKLEDLADFGTTESNITEIKNTLEEFKGLIGKPRVILNEKYVAIASLEGFYDETNSVLKNKLDKLMLIFRESNSEFFDGYIRARAIVNA
jgi:hypothetical protein